MNARTRVLVVGAIALGLVATAGVQDVAAQRPGRRGGTEIGIRGAPQGPGAEMVERALRLADELELSGEQREQLDALRTELLAVHRERANRLMELGSEIRAGMREPEALRGEMEALRDSREAQLDGMRGRFDEILSEDQRSELESLGRPRMERRRGDGFRGMRGRRDFRGQRGLRGRGRRGSG